MNEGVYGYSKNSGMDSACAFRTVRFCIFWTPENAACASAVMR